MLSIHDMLQWCSQSSFLYPRQRTICTGVSCRSVRAWHCRPALLGRRLAWKTSARCAVPHTTHKMMKPCNSCINTHKWVLFHSLGHRLIKLSWLGFYQVTTVYGLLRVMYKFWFFEFSPHLLFSLCWKDYSIESNKDTTGKSLMKQSSTCGEFCFCSISNCKKEKKRVAYIMRKKNKGAQGTKLNCDKLRA